MKKLTKKNLDELANSLPTISESEQKSCNGGSFVYDQSGALLGERGTGNDIIIASSLYEAGIGFSLASPEAFKNVLSTMASGIGINGAIGLTYINDNRYAQTDQSGNISFNYYSELLSSNNYYDYLSILHHEHHHQMTLDDHGTHQSEYQALIHQINHSSFQYVSDSLKEDTMTNYYNLHNGQSYY